MNVKKFHDYMNAIDPKFLEEAQIPAPKKKVPVYAWIGSIAAAVAVLVISVVAIRTSQRKTTTEDNFQNMTMMACAENPVQVVTTEDVAQLGYDVMEWDDAVYTTIDMGERYAAPMTQTCVTIDGSEYTYRALQTDEAEDISGMYYDWEDTLFWTVDNVELQLQVCEEASLLTWYDPVKETECSISVTGDINQRESFMNNAREIMEILGYNVSVAPEGASDVYYRVQKVGDLVAGETSFVYEGVAYAYRIASTIEVKEDFDDISGTTDDFEQEKEGKVQYCPARLSYNTGKNGKIVWFDVVPGLLYSITMEDKAAEASLLSMAEMIFVPAQGEVDGDNEEDTENLSEEGNEGQQGEENPENTEQTQEEKVYRTTKDGARIIDPLSNWYTELCEKEQASEQESGAENEQETWEEEEVSPAENSETNKETQTTQENVQETEQENEQEESQERKLLPEGLKDGEYEVLLEVSDIEEIEDGICFPMEFILFDYYASDDINSLEVGDYIVICGEEILVEKVEHAKRGSGVIMNGGLTEGGYEFDYVPMEDAYRIFMENDSPLYYSAGFADFLLSEEALFEDESDLENPGAVIYEYDEIVDALTRDNYFLEIEIKEGKLYKLHLSYRP